ncbi:MAG: Eco57I restriction-modification methylase domain-containing protein [Treponema sp.]|jgi:hypothetical protein|nr:Eco57I restriction-modification methylase domain-containing protein [Treponema sp.]
MSYLDILENDYPGSEAFLESCLKPVFGTAQKTRLSVAAALSDSEKSIIKDIFIFGRTDNFVLNDMNFFDVTVQDGVDIARSRVMIQRAVRKSLDVYQAAIVLFHHSDNAGLWRFSFIYKEASAKDATSARRYSYLCGKEQHCRTAADNLEKLEKIPGKKKLEDVTTVFSIEALTEDFFKRLFKWYDTWALDVIRFPAGKGKNARLPTTIDDAVKKENRQHLIRLITRLIFVWFLKHKEELIPGWIFDIRELKELIHHFDEHDDKSGAYYNAVLQNLFFAILNCEISKRRFFDDKDGRDGYSIKAQFRDHVDKPMIKIPHSEFIKKFETTPFLNGGLFECLDHREGHEEQEYKDGFSRESKRAAFVPNCLFFGDGEHAGEGIINIFSEYNFTIEENTPHDIEVALDPELLGKVFENLLGTYNEETAGTARKESGSFYTPREIVDYMVDASLKEYFKTKLNMPPPAETDKNLDGLFSRSIEGHGFSQDQTTILIEAIYHCRILDPACGSGAFPMGVLNKLVLILEKLDPENSQWKEIQIQKAIKETEEAYRTGAEEERKERLRKVQEVFEQSTGRCANYARKLYLIENGIYGVDVQPIAIQISKLRFFISLIVDQKTGGTKTNNYNVLPLPNLETKFVAANTLIGIKRIQEGYQHEFADPKIEEIQKELLEVRHKHFSPRTVKEKERLRKEDSVLSKELSALLKKDGFYNASDAQKMADWNPYGQTKSADFFDAWWMFGIKDGFDVVIGNPPYIETRKIDYKIKNYETENCGNLYALCYERAILLANNKSLIGFIIPVASVCTDGYYELQKLCIHYGSLYISCYNDRPGKLFDGLEHIRLSIVLLNKGDRTTTINSTRYNKWNTIYRDFLFENLMMADVTSLTKNTMIPKSGNHISNSMLKKVNNNNNLSKYLIKTSKHKIFYTRKLSGFVQILDFIPKIKERGGKIRQPSELKELFFENKERSLAYLAVFNSSFFYWFLTIWSDCRNLNQREIQNFPFDISTAASENISKLNELSLLLMEDIKRHSLIKEMTFKNAGILNIQCIYPKLSKPIIDEIDRVLAKHYGFTEEELDFIINYDIKYRMGGELEGDG